jgi:uncharacterized protein (DUF362 family)
MNKLDRREFIKLASIGLSTLAGSQFLSSCQKKLPALNSTETSQPLLENEETQSPQIENTATLKSDYPSMVVARGENPEKLINQGIKAIGGLARFMKPGADVIIKPNICVGYNTYEFASTTNPWVVGALVKLCLEAGAKKVRVMDYPFGGPAPQCYKYSGIEEQVIANGGVMEVMQSIKYVHMIIPGAKQLKEVTIYPDVLDADLLINVPIAKTHSMAGLTLGLKNLMGTIQKRETIHPSFPINLVDLATLVRPQLTVIDAVRTLMANGPTGGDLGDVKLQNTVIISPDIVMADSYATTLFGMTAGDIPYILSAEERGLGLSDYKSVKIEELTVGS